MSKKFGLDNDLNNNATSPQGEEHENKQSLMGAIFPTEPPRTNSINAMNRNRLMAGFIVILALFILLIFRMGYWQIVKADDLKLKATAMQKADTELDSERGIIYDSSGNVLAKSITEYQLYGYASELYNNSSLTTEEKALTVTRLAKLIDKTEEETTTLLETADKKKATLLGTGLTQKEVDKAKDYWGDNIYVTTKVRRYYPNGAFASQILGSVDSENNGRGGLEYMYNQTLSGVNGRTILTTDRDGNAVAGGSSTYYKAEDGLNLVTSLDSVIQGYVEEALEAGLERTGAEGVTCLVMNPKTGEVLAYAQLPEYDPNEATQPSNSDELTAFEAMSQDEQNDYLSQMWRIEGISDLYDPGSTFKLITAASALELGTADENSTYYCNGHITVGGITLNCTGVHGTQSLKVAVGNSCNPGLAKTALDMGATNFYRYIKLFGFNEKTGIDLPGESDSIVKATDSLSDVDLATTGYGQGISITPIQLLCAINALGNNGVLMKPTVVSQITDSSGNVVSTIDPTEVRQVITKETADKMKDMMEYYTTEAGGTEAYVAGFRIGGKTGTANIASGGRYSDATNTSYVAMAPMDDPVISMLVVVHKPTKVQYGNNTAGPIVKEIMEKALTYLGVEREYTSEEAAIAEKEQVTVPDVSGNDSKKAISAITALGLNYKIEPATTDDNSFVVVDQYPKAGSKIAKGGTVYIYSK